MTPETPSPSVTTVGERRDAIARIVDPEAWADKRIAFPVVRKSRAFTKADAILSLESPAQVTGEGVAPVADREAVNRLKAVASSFPDHNDRDGIGWTRVRWDDLNAVLASTPTANAPVAAAACNPSGQHSWIYHDKPGHWVCGICSVKHPGEAALPPHSDIEGLREALRPFAEQRTSDELMRETGGLASSEWANASVERRIEMMGERRREKDANILRARTVLGGL